MSKLFTVAGVSTLNGSVDLRFTNHLNTRKTVLAKNGHTDINLIELPKAMSKEDAIAHLASVEPFKGMAVVKSAQMDATKAVKNKAPAADKVGA